MAKCTNDNLTVTGARVSCSGRLMWSLFLYKVRKGLVWLVVLLFCLKR